MPTRTGRISTAATSDKQKLDLLNLDMNSARQKLGYIAENKLLTPQEVDVLNGIMNELDSLHHNVANRVI